MATRPGSEAGLTRRQLLVGAATVGGVALLGAAGVAAMPGSLKNKLGLGPEAFVPDAPEGQVRLETVFSEARGQDVHLFTAVPHGFGDGAGLPVVVVLHGASTTASDFQELGLGRFLTAAVSAGTPPFVLAGADGGLSRWEPTGDDDPQAMVVVELPEWLSERGFDAETRALWGWSMGGYGALRVAELNPGWARALALFSPAVSTGDAALSDLDELAGLPTAVWCGEQDPLYDDVRSLVADLPEQPVSVTYGPGGHSKVYWNDHTLEAFSFLGEELARSGTG